MDRERLLTEFFNRMSNMRRFLSMLHASETTAKGMPTRAQFAVMAALSHETKSVKALAGTFCMTSSAVTQLVNALVKDGTLARTEDKKDRRTTVVSLTAKGRTLLAAGKKARRTSLRKLLAPLNDTEIRQLHAIQEKLIAHLDRV